VISTRLKVSRFSCLLLTLCFALNACTDQSAVESASIDETDRVDAVPDLSEGLHHTDSIKWFEGNVDEAFLFAKQENKPVFLYWGAVWCPPCQEIKQTVFKSRRFITLSESFVPVYLDGDTSQAQTVGEKFGVKGYPTMILFNPVGAEITRIPGGIDISRYNDVLALGLNSITPTATLVSRILGGGDKLNPADFQQLAYYSWGQDHNALPEDYTPDVFLKMADASPEPIASARLYMQYLLEVADTRSSSELSSNPNTITDAENRVRRILEDDQLVLACWEYFAYSTEELMPVIVDAREHPRAYKQLSELWQTRMKSLSQSSVLSTAEQVAGLLPAIYFYFEPQSADRETKKNPAPWKISAEFKQEILSAVQQADRVTKNSFARQSVVSQLNYILQTAHLREEAKTLLLAELKRSTAAYYFMSSLASIAEEDGDESAALDWRKKAWETSQGTATRFQWGANYVRTLIRISPQDETLIAATALNLINEMEPGEAAFSGRNFRVLRSMTNSLNQWSGDRSSDENTTGKNSHKDNQPMDTASNKANRSGRLAEYHRLIENRCQAQEKVSTAYKNCSTLIQLSPAD